MIETRPFKTWQFYHFIKKTFGKSFLTSLYKVSPRQVDRWSCDPAFSESAQQNGIDKYNVMLKSAMDIGEARAARCAVRRQARIVECFLTPMGDSEPDKSTLSDEMLDDFPAVVRLHDAIRNREDEIIVRDLLSEAKEELNQTFTSHVRRMAKDK